jgi:phage N-6-adenine-methyltransferase
MSGPLMTTLAERINAAHDAAHAAAKTAIEHAIECGRLLLEAKASVAHGEWLPWIEANLSFGARQAQKYIRIAKSAEELPNANSNSHLTIDGALTALSTSHALRVMGSSASDEWYTPPHIFELALDVIGEFDLDPSWHPDSPVRASTTYTEADDGLARAWHGRTWLNPPHGREIGEWIDKLVSEYEAGQVTEAMALIPARVDTQWFRRLDPYPRCYVYGRLVFANSEVNTPFPRAIPYLGSNVECFIEVFGSVGGIWARIDTERAP